MIDFIPFSAVSFDENEERAVLEVLRSGWITTGPRCAEFETSFAEYVGARHAVAVTSATAGLHILLSALGVGPGDEVVTPSMNWCSTPNMIRLLGATPVFVDVEPETLNISVEDLARVMSPKTKAVVPVHYAGRAYDFAGVRSVMEGHDAVLIDDAAHAVGTTFNGQPVGSLADASCFSFHPIKNMTTGEGGMVTSDDEELIGRLKLWKFHGVNRDAFKRYSANSLPHYDIAFPGYKYNLTDIQAALGIEQLKKLDQFIETRAAQAVMYQEGLKDLPLRVPPPEARPDCRHAWHLFVVQVTDDSSLSREYVMMKLKERNVGTGLHFMPVHSTSAFRDTAHVLPVTDDVGKRIFSLPMYPGLSADQQDYVMHQLRKVFSK